MSIGGGIRPYTRCPVGGQLVIQPMGDSITAGLPLTGGFRAPLLGMLADARGGSVGVGGVVNSWGSMPNALYGYPATCGSAMDGHWGSGAQQWVQNEWMSLFDPVPDLVSDVHFGTLLLGANDVGDPPTNSAAAFVLELAAEFFGLHPLANLFVSNRLPRSFAGTANFNAILAAGIAAMRTAGQNVVLVDLFSIVTLADLYDGLHPTESANQRIAARWFAAMAPYVRP